MILWLTLLACSGKDVAPTGWPDDGCGASTPAEGQSSSSGSTRERTLTLDDGTELAVAVRWPAGRGCVGAVVYAPPGLDPGTGAVLTEQSKAFAAAGAALITYDPRGRGDSTGEEDANGRQGQEDFAAVIRWAAWQDRVDPAQVVVYSRSFGGALAAGALGADPELTVRGWVDYESPGWLQDDLDHTTEHTRDRMNGLAEDSGDVDAWFAEREPAGLVGDVAVPYHRMQGIPDHALDYLQAAVAMVNGATGSPRVSYNGVVQTDPLTEDEAYDGAYDGGLDPDGDTLRAEVLNAFKN